MIPRAFITAWRAEAPWTIDAQVEQDLVICRAIVELFRVPELADSLAFRGGTALYKLYSHPRPATQRTSTWCRSGRSRSVESWTAHALCWIHG